MFFQTHLSPEIGSFEVISQGVLQCLNETEVVHGLPGSRGSRAGRQAGTLRSAPYWQGRKRHQTASPAPSYLSRPVQVCSQG